MPFVIDYTPAGAVAQLGQQAGQAADRARQLDFQRQLDLQANEFNQQNRLAGFQARQDARYAGMGGRGGAGAAPLSPQQEIDMAAQRAAAVAMARESATAPFDQARRAAESEQAVDRARATTQAREEVQADFDQQEAARQEQVIRQSLAQQGIVGQQAEQELARFRARRAGYREPGQDTMEVAGADARNLYNLARAGRYDALQQIIQASEMFKNIDANAAQTIADVESAMMIAAQDMTLDEARAALSDPSLPSQMRPVLTQRVASAGATSVNNPSASTAVQDRSDDELLRMFYQR